MAFHRYCPHLSKLQRRWRDGGMAAGSESTLQLHGQQEPWSPVAADGYGRWLPMGFTQNNVVIFHVVKTMQ